MQVLVQRGLTSVERALIEADSTGCLPLPLHVYASRAFPTRLPKLGAGHLAAETATSSRGLVSTATGSSAIDMDVDSEAEAEAGRRSRVTTASRSSRERTTMWYAQCCRMLAPMSMPFTLLCGCC